MSDYQNRRVVKDNDVGKKMPNVKEKNPPLRYRHKRPDKQLYVPRALRKTDMENNTNTRIKSSVNCFQATYLIPEIQQPEIDSSLQNHDPNNVKDIKITNSELDSIFNVEQSNISLFQEIKDSDKKKAVDFVSQEDLSLNNHEQYMDDINKSCGILKIDIDIKESTKSNEKNSNISKDTMDLETVAVTENNVPNTEITNEVLQNSNEDSYNPIDVVEVKVQGDLSSEIPEDSWETMFNDDGDCLDPKFIKELCAITGRIDLAIAKNDYSNYQPVSKNSAEEFQNIVELFGFPVEFSTQDLTSAFSAFQEASYNIKWVDDCHALAIFSSPTIALQALQLSHPFIKVRPVSEGIKESKEKARFCARMFEDHKPRPVTSAALARRLVSGALGLKVNASKEQRDIERNILKEAKEKKKIKARQRQDIWNGIVS